MEIDVMGELITRARLGKKISSVELAKQVGKSQATISRIENSKQGVNLTLLCKIAQVLEVHPLSFLGRLDKEVVGRQVSGLLQKELRAGRERSRLSVSEVARELQVTEKQLQDIETGQSCPTEVEFERLCSLYPVDAKKLTELYMAEMLCPQVSGIVDSLNNALHDCLVYFDQQGAVDNSAQQLSVNLRQLVGSTKVDERRAGYFSIGHFSDKLLAALQNPKFHAQAEDLAHKWVAENVTEYEKIVQDSASSDDSSEEV